jgi:hypothetical protein
LESYFPVGQFVQVVKSELTYLPLSHPIQDVEPEPLLNLPEGHVVHDPAPALAEYFPEGQDVQPDEVYEFEP